MKERDKSSFGWSNDRRIDQLCDAFERRWLDGERPNLEEYLLEVEESSRGQLLCELMGLEVHYLRRVGESPALSEYRLRFPEYSSLLQQNFTSGPSSVLPGAGDRPFAEEDHFDTGMNHFSEDNGAGPPLEWIGPYRVERILGKGAFKSIYLAHDSRLSRDVAIAVPHPNLTRDAIEIFLREARILAGFDHPSIVPVFEVGDTDDGLSYVVEKFIQGHDLAHLLCDRTPTASESAQLIATVAETLQYVHLHGLVHRDIKPANIMLDGKGAPILIDFGLALLDEDFGKRACLAGTAPYMSPEQARNEGHLVDGRSDIFSLGVVFYEALTGVLPFRGKTVEEILKLIINLDPRPLRQIVETTSRELERICLKALSKRPSDRYNTASEMAEDLSLFLHPPLTETRKVDGELRRTEISADAAPIVPKGLRCYDENDRDFFLRLLPGPRGREGLPESLRFWKTPIEDRSVATAFRVGVLYGPSGSGKSSLLKAGLLPRLSGVKIVQVEANAEDTESGLLAGLRDACPEIPNDLDLVSMAAAIRRNAGEKILIVLDQFEQFLHGTRSLGVSAVTDALRQCDGGNLQCLLIVRDDFWMGVTRFMRELDIPLVEGRNSAAVDLFDRRHARKILVEFGCAYGTLPVKRDAMTPDQEIFLDEVVAGLTREDKVIPVQLALFAEMVKGKTWTSRTVREVGGTRGIGLRFLNETFHATSAPPEHRVHENAARAILRALLPEHGEDIKGHARLESELRELSGYASRPRDFEDLMRILDSEVRLLMPVDAALPGIDGGELVEKRYELTHDYLVSSLREWLTLRMKETARGRARIRLAERASLWRSRGERRQLPSLVEWILIRSLIRTRQRTTTERNMLHVADRHHALRIGVASLMLGLGMWLTFAVVGHFEGRRLYDALVRMDLERVPEFIETEIEPRLHSVGPRLRAGAENLSDPGVRLRLSLALLSQEPRQVSYLRDRLLNPEAPPKELRILRKALAPHGADLTAGLWDELENGTVGQRRFLAACALAAYAEPGAKRWAGNSLYISSQLVQQHPLQIELWIELLDPIRAVLVPHLKNQISSRRGLVGLNAASALTVYLEDRKQGLIKFLRTSDPTPFRVIVRGLNDEESRRFLERELSRSRPPNLSEDDFAREQSLVVLALLAVHGDVKDTWNHFRESADQRLRSYLIHNAIRYGVDDTLLAKRFDKEDDVSVRRALILILAGSEPEFIPAGRQSDLVRTFLRVLEEDPDPGVHSAAELLLSRWGQDVKVQSALERLRNNPPTSQMGWYISSEGHTMAILPDPSDFEPDAKGVEQFDTAVSLNRHRNKHEPRRDIPRRISVATKEVTVRQFLRFIRDKKLDEGKTRSELTKFAEYLMPENGMEKMARQLARFVASDVHAVDARTLERPIQGVSTQHAVEYCIWLSRRDGLEACYEKNTGGEYRFYPERSGYRLPTFAEWEFACRAGTMTLTHFGALALAKSYAWYTDNCEESQPVGQLLPNDFGLFDVHGNLGELCECCYHKDCNVDPVRGGAYRFPARYFRTGGYPVIGTYRYYQAGFRIVRTIVDGPKGQ